MTMIYSKPWTLGKIIYLKKEFPRRSELFETKYLIEYLISKVRFLKGREALKKFYALKEREVTTEVVNFYLYPLKWLNQFYYKNNPQFPRLISKK